MRTKTKPAAFVAGPQFLLRTTNWARSQYPNNPQTLALNFYSWQERMSIRPGMHVCVFVQSVGQPEICYETIHLQVSHVELFPDGKQTLLGDVTSVPKLYKFHGIQRGTKLKFDSKYVTFIGQAS
jgi:hypothetical protein